MNTDLRLSIGFRDHAKIVKLHKLLGEAGVASIVTLWAYVAAYRPKGVLSGMDIADVEIASRWSGENGALVETLHGLRLIDCPACKTSDSWEPHKIVMPVAIHDWEDWQPWAFRADERSALAREKARKRWDKEKAKKERICTLETGEIKAGCKLHKEMMPLAPKSDAAGNATASKIDAPLLSFPSPEILKTPLSEPPVSDGSNGDARKPSRRHQKRISYPDAFTEFWKAYPRAVGKMAAFEAWLRVTKDGYPSEDILRATEEFSGQMKREGREISKIRHPERFLKKDFWKEFCLEEAPCAQS